MAVRIIISSVALAAAASFIAHEHGSLHVHAFPMARINPLIQNSDRRRLPISYALPPSIDDDVSITEDKNGTNHNSNGQDAQQQQSIRQTLFDQLENMRKQFTEMSESLSRAKEREEQARETVVTLKEQRRSVELEKEEAISSQKSVFV